MALYLVTGLPGTGKSEVYGELKTRGVEAYDGDYDRLAHWFNNQTGLPVESEHERTPGFLESHSRDIAREVVLGLARKAENKQIFLCADPENEDELVDLFECIYALVIDEDIRQKRLETRTNNQWGKLPHEIAYDQAIKPIAQARYDKYGYTVINSEQPVSQIVDFILADSHK